MQRCYKKLFNRCYRSGDIEGVQHAMRVHVAGHIHYRLLIPYGIPALSIGPDADVGVGCRATLVSWSCELRGIEIFLLFNPVAKETLYLVQE